MAVTKDPNGLTPRTYELAPKVLAKVEQGRSIVSACESIGLSCTSFKKWCMVMKVRVKVQRKPINSPWRNYKSL